MTGYKIINLNLLQETIGESETSDILSSFSCPQNVDVERFLRSTAIPFAKQGISQTHLVFASFQENPVLVGYFTLANKYIHVASKILSSTQRKRISKFATFNPDMKCYCMTAPLIAQLGKNFTNGYNKLITGDELLQIACDKIKKIQLDIGGKFAYLECEDTPHLTEFYQRNGFYNFGKRQLDRDEYADYDSRSLVQLMKYLK